MRRTFLGMAIVFAAVGATFAAWAAPTPKNTSHSWEYKVIERPKNPANYEKTLNRLGEEGWEYCDTYVVPEWTGDGGRDVTVLNSSVAVSENIHT